jgi:hypothetical protein
MKKTEDIVPAEVAEKYRSWNTSRTRKRKPVQFR